MQGIPQGQSSPNGSTGGGSQKPSLSWQSPAQSAPAKPASNEKVKPAATTPPKTTINNAKVISSADTSNTGTYVAIFVGGLIVGALLGSIITGRATSGASSTATTTDNGTPAAITDSNTPLTGSSMEAGTVEVSASQSAGSSVVVSKVDVTEPTWVVVYDNNAGTPGRALGATLFLPTASGGATSGTVDLLRPTVSGMTYLVGQRVDDGDFNLSFQKDAPVLDSNGQPMLMTLSAN